MGHKGKQEKDAIWLFDMLDGDTGSFLRMKKPGEAEADTRSPWERNHMGRLMLEKKGKGVYFIKWEESYLRFEEPRALAYNKVECTDKPDKNCRIELKLV